MTDANSRLTNRIVLYVEDPMTEAYLNTLLSLETGWLEIVPMGGREAVSGGVTVMRQRGDSRVFGWLDSDFGESNRNNWGNQDVKCFVGRGHEIENYLLDWPMMQKAAKMQDFDFEAAARRLAEGMRYTVACCEELAGLRSIVESGFPTYPNVSDMGSLLTSVVQARDYILNNPTNQPWIARVCRELPLQTTPQVIQDALEDIAAKRQRELDDGTWVLRYPGKEICRQLVQDVFHGTTSVEVFARQIAEAQRETGAIPDDFKALVSELKKRKALVDAAEAQEQNRKYQVKIYVQQIAPEQKFVGETAVSLQRADLARPAFDFFRDAVYTLLFDAGYFPRGFGCATRETSRETRKIEYALSCSGKHVELAAKNGQMMPVASHSTEGCEFRIRAILTDSEKTFV